MRGVSSLPVMGFHASASPLSMDPSFEHAHKVRQCDLSEVALSHEDWKRREEQKQKYMREIKVHAREIHARKKSACTK